MKAFVKVITTDSGLEMFEGTLTNNQGKVFHKAVRWSEDGAIRALATYLHENDGEGVVTQGLVKVSNGGSSQLSLLYPGIASREV